MQRIACFKSCSLIGSHVNCEYVVDPVKCGESVLDATLLVDWVKMCEYEVKMGFQIVDGVYYGSRSVAVIDPGQKSMVMYVTVAARVGVASSTVWRHLCQHGRTKLPSSWATQDAGCGSKCCRTHQ